MAPESTIVSVLLEGTEAIPCVCVCVCKIPYISISIYLSREKEINKRKGKIYSQAHKGSGSKKWLEFSLYIILTGEEEGEKGYLTVIQMTFREGKMDL